MSDVNTAPVADSSSAPEADASSDAEAPAAPQTKAPAKASKSVAPPPGQKNAAQQTQPAAEPKDEKPQPPSKRKYALKVDGEEFEEELSDEDIVVRLQKERAARKRWNELSAQQKQLEQFIELGKKDPIAAAKELWGVDAESLVQKRIAEKYAQELKEKNMPPEERLRNEYETKLKAAQEEAAKVRAEAEAKEMERLTNETMERTKAEFSQALEAEGLPKTWKALREMAHVAKLAHSAGYSLTPAQLATEVRSRLEARENELHEEVLGGLQGEALLKRFKPEVVKAIVKAVLEQKKAASTPAASAPIKTQQKAKSVLEELTPGQKRKALLGLR